MDEHTGDLLQRQNAFTACLRDPSVPSPPGLDPARVAIYQGLVISKLTGLLENAFPVSAALAGQDPWARLSADFLRCHHSQTPLFTELAAEFLLWLRSLPELPHPALAELAHYEWVETALFQLDALPPPPLRGDPFAQPLQRSPLALLLVHTWPVHLLGPGHAPGYPPEAPTALLVRRDQQGLVRFSVLGPLAAQLLLMMEAEPGHTGAGYLDRLALQHAVDARDLLSPFQTLLLELGDQGVIGQADPAPHCTGTA